MNAGSDHRARAEAHARAEAEELFDVLDGEGRPTGTIRTRREVHRDGDWHRALHVWIVDEANRVVFQRRSLAKDLAGGRIDVTVGGHLRAGETWPEALREVQEELGVVAEVHQVRHLGTLFSERVYPDAIDREVQEVFVFPHDQPLDRYLLHPHEVEALYAVPLARAIQLYRDGRHVPGVGWDVQRRPVHALLHVGDLIEEGRETTLEELRLLASWAEIQEPGRDELD
jgi:isopentenyldiphosphate isomerase